MSSLSREFYARSPELVAAELIGKQLVSRGRGWSCSGRIVETEAYLSRSDPASHSARGVTASNRSMFQNAGIAYVYPIHAKYCFNVVTESEGQGSAVLIRAIHPIDGIDVMSARRAREKIVDLASGPAKLCQALAIDRSLDGHDLVDSERLTIVEDDSESSIDVRSIKQTPRIGVTSAKTRRLRFVLQGSKFASGPKSMR